MPCLKLAGSTGGICEEQIKKYQFEVIDLLNIKSLLFTENTRFVATTLFGLEDVLAAELRSLGARDIEKLKRAVAFGGDMGFMYKANLSLRTAIRVLVPLKTFTAQNKDQLYSELKKISWEDFIEPSETLAVDAGVASSIFSHSKYIALKTKDAVVDRFRQKFKTRPSVDVVDPAMRINVHVHEDEFIISLDSSGSPLFKRGYREQTNVAPLNEALASGMILLSGWNGRRVFCDPMTGSGTLATEAALIALNLPAGFLRKKFGFMNWKNFNAELWNVIYESAMKKADFPLNESQVNPHIFASDISPNNLKKAKQNFYNAKIKPLISTQTTDFLNLKKPAEAGTLIMNPPYGERMNKDESNKLYRAFGDALKKNWIGWEAWIISSNKEALKNVGLQASKKITLYNGALECKFMKYEMYGGSREKKEKN